MRNQVLTRTATSGGATLVYTYDRVGNLKTLKDGRGTTSYTYDVRNLLTNLTDGAGKPWRFKYDDDGRRTDTYFNSTSDTAYAMRTHTAYDNDGRIRRITTTRASSASTVVSDVSYCFAPFVSGQSCPTASTSADTSLRQWSRDERTGTVSQFTYDKANHLTRATNVDGHTYDFTYDANANRATQKVDGTQNQSLTFNSANQITNAAATYDGAGNQTTLQAVGGNYTLAYNAAGQMTKTTAPAANGGATDTFAYAGPDQVELVAAGSTKYVYGIADQFDQPWIQSFSRSGQTGYIERDGNGTPLGLNLNGTDHAYVLDTLGSVIGLIDANGNVTATYGYNPYGTIGTQTGTTASANPIRYTGGLALDDANTRLTKLGHRYNTTQYGRFTQQDTFNQLADPTNGNRYTYAACNPTNNTDSTGQINSTICSLIVGAAGIALGIGLTLIPGLNILTLIGLEILTGAGATVADIELCG